MSTRAFLDILTGRRWPLAPAVGPRNGARSQPGRSRQAGGRGRPPVGGFATPTRRCRLDSADRVGRESTAQFVHVHERRERVTALVRCLARVYRARRSARRTRRFCARPRPGIAAPCGRPRRRPVPGPDGGFYSPGDVEERPERRLRGGSGGEGRAAPHELAEQRDPRLGLLARLLDAELPVGGEETIPEQVNCADALIFHSLAEFGD